MPATRAFLDLVNLYKDTPIEFPLLKPVSVAMWILESGRGTSKLATDHNNFAGIKWRREMQPFATRVSFSAHDGTAFYCHFNSLKDFTKGFWAFLDRPPYNGWRDHASDPEDFIGFVGPIWAENPRYVEKVLDLMGEADQLIGESAPVCEGCGDDEVDHDHDTVDHDHLVTSTLVKPTVDRFVPTSHQQSRNGADIDYVVIHYTTSRNINGTISHFKNGRPRTSAHYIVGRDGELVQMVKDSDRSWHSGKSTMNARSIGIEHVAAPGDKITDEQATKSSSLIAWLMNEYRIQKSHVIPHVCVKSTDCCGDLFKDFGGGLGKSCDAQTRALHLWMTKRGIV